MSTINRKAGNVPSKKSSGAGSSTPAAKRRRVTGLVIGAPSDADAPNARNSAPGPSSSASSVRPVYDGVPSLSTLCIRSFVENIEPLVSDWEVYRTYVKMLPEPLLRRLFNAMKTTCPLRMSHAVVHAYFFRGHTLALSSDLPVTKQTISSISELGSNLRDLELSGFEKYSDDTFASLLCKLPGLKRLILRGSAKVGPKTVQAVADTCPELESINLSYTAATPASIGALLKRCASLQVLKLAGVPNWTDTTFSKLIAELGKDFQLPNMQTLKFRQTALTEHSINTLVLACPNLRRIDISFTPIRRAPSLETIKRIPPLEKLSLKSIQAPPADILALLSNLPHLKTLSLGALGGGSGTTSIRNSSAMTLSDDVLISLTAILETMHNLENVDLVGNIKLGATGRRISSPLANFVTRVGRRCKTLNLGGIPSLVSSDLIGLLPDDGAQTSPLQTLILSNTGVGDEAAPYIASCTALVSLDLSGAKFDYDGLFLIIDNCIYLERLSLTSCRSIKVADRRRFFEVWKEHKEEG